MTANHNIDTLVVHCSATQKRWPYSGQSAVEEIRRWHVEDRGFADIGYHWLIDRDGTTLEGRPESVMGAHARGHNSGSIGICLIGGYGSRADGLFFNSFTLAQDVALRALITRLKGRYGIRRIIGHNEVSAKACPGFKVARWLRQPTAQDDKPPSRFLPPAKAVKAAPLGAGVVGIGHTAVGELAQLEPLAQAVAVAVLSAVALVLLWSYVRDKL